MVPPLGTEVSGVNTRTGVTDDPAKYVLMVIEAKCSWAPAEINSTKVPVLLVSMITPALLVVAAAMVVDAA